MTSAGIIPKPSDTTLIRLASIAAHVEELLAADQPTDKVRVGIMAMKNDRRRRMEAILVLLADADVRDYLEELEKLGLLPVNR